MVEPGKPTPIGQRRLQLAGKAVDVNMKIDHFESVASRTNGVATYAFNVTFKAKEKPGETDKAFSEKKFSHKIYVHASDLDKALQILHTMGHKFKQMTRGELQQYLERDFSQIQTRREHDEKKGTTFHLGTHNKVTDEIDFEEVALSKKELEDLHVYANYLKSDQALQDGVISPESQLELENISPYGEVTLEREDGVTFNVHASSVPEGATVNLAYPTANPGLTVDLKYQSSQQSIKSKDLLRYSREFFTNPKIFHSIGELLSQEGRRVFLSYLPEKPTLEDLQQAFRLGAHSDVEAAMNNPDYDSAELEAAYEALDSNSLDQERIHLFLEKLTEYNELHDQLSPMGTPVIRNYQKKAFLKEIEQNKIQSTGNKLELLDLYEQAFPGIREAVISIKSEEETFTEEEFSQALAQIMEKSYGALLDMPQEVRHSYFTSPVLGIEGVTMAQALEDATGRNELPLGTFSGGIHDRLVHLVRNSLLPLGALLPDTEKARENREKKRKEVLEIRQQYVRDACAQIDQIIAIGKKFQTGQEVSDQERQLFEALVYRTLSEKQGHVRVYDRLIHYSKSDGSLDLNKLMKGEKAFLKQAFGIDIQGESFETFFTNYMKYLSGKEDLSTVDKEKVAKVF